MNLDVTVLLSTTATMLLLIFVGYGGAKSGLFNEEFTRKMSSLIVNICQPALLVSSLWNVDYSPQKLAEGASIVLLSAGVHLVNIIVAFGAGTLIRQNGEKTIIRYATIFSNCAFFGFPVLREVFGEEGVFWGAFYCIIFNILVWTVGMFVLSRSDRSIKMNLRKTFINLGTVPVAIGILLYVTRLAEKLPAPITQTLGYLSGLCTPLSMLLIGALLARIPLKKVFLSPKAYYLCLIKLVILPICVGLIGHLIGLRREFVCFAMLMAGFPVAATTSAFAQKHDIVPEFSSVCVGFTTVLSVGTVPLIIMVADKLL